MMKRFTLLLIFCMASCWGMAQGPGAVVTYAGKDVTLQEVFEAINKQTGYEFAFSFNTLKDAKPVTLDVKNVPVEDVLKTCFKDQPLTYVIDKRTIIIREKEVPAPPKAEPPKKKERTEISGTITDKAGAPMPGVSIFIKGTNAGTVSDANGKYSIEAKDNDVLVFSFIGYKKIETQIGGRVVIDQTMEEEVSQLSEVVINAGYYDVKDKEKTGSISRVTADVIEKQPVTNVLGALQGRMPGVYIQQASGVPGGEFRIQIRGRNSLRDEGNEPLYIVDGIPFSTEKTFSYYTAGNFGLTPATNTDGVSQVSPFTSLNQADIESIEILKDADATAIYGSRGANGVVLITTKKGKAGKTKFSLNAYTGIGKAQMVEMLNTSQYLAMLREGFANNGLVPSANPNDPGYSPELMVWDTTRYTDWQKYFMGGTAHSTSIQSSLSGGSENTQFLFSLGYRREGSVYPEDCIYQKKSFHVSSNHRSANKKFSISTSITGAKDDNNQPSVSINNRNLAPNAPALYDDKGNLNWENSTWINPLARAGNRYSNAVLNFTGSTIIGYEILPGLQFKTSGGIAYLNSNERTKYPHTQYDPVSKSTSAGSFVNVASGTNQSWIIEPQLNYEKEIGKGKLIMLGGSTFQEQRLERRADHYRGFPSDALMDNLGAASVTSNYEFVLSLYRYMALFGRLNYTWDGKYVINFTARRDGSSRFGPGKQFANFGAIGVAWIFSGESFLKDHFPFISFGKLRTSYGSTGNDQIGNYQYLDTYSTNTSTSISDQYQGVTWISPSKLFNADYAWEVNKKFEAALELGFLNDRLSLAVSYFRNRSSNQLVNYTLPQTTGFTGILANLLATVENTGIEIELTSVNLQSAFFSWETSWNFTAPRNKLVEFANLESSTYANRYVIGKPITSVKVYQSTGVNPETGLYSFIDVNGDGIISLPHDNTKVMFVGQDFYGGINNSLTVKGWSLDIFFQFVKQTGFTGHGSGSVLPGTGNIPAFMLDKKIWRQPGDIAEIQKLISGNNETSRIARSNFLNSDATIGDASFIRLKNVSLSYKLPERWTKGLACRLYFQGQNLLLLTKYEGDDPENQYFNNLPPLKMFTIGAQLTL